MTARKPYADALRELGLDFNKPGVLAAFDLMLDKAGVARDGEARQQHKITNPEGFFTAVRKVTGPLDQIQGDTINRLLAAAAHWPLGWLAYGLATAWHEARFEPQPEWGKGKGKAYGKPGRHGQPQYGRGLVQLTWDKNYEWADKALGLNGTLLKNFDRALEPEIATAILVKGMEEGVFTGKSLADYLPGEHGTWPQFVEARRIINGVDRAQDIANLASEFQGAGSAGGWG